MERMGKYTKDSTGAKYNFEALYFPQFLHKIHVRLYIILIYYSNTCYVVKTAKFAQLKRLRSARMTLNSKECLRQLNEVTIL